MLIKYFPQKRRSDRLRRRARLAMQGRTKKSVFFGWFRVPDNTPTSSTGQYDNAQSVEHPHRVPLSAGTKIVLILAGMVFLFIALIPFLAMIKLLFTPG